MTDYELERFCERNPMCDCYCLKCPAFISNQRNRLGLDENDECEDDDNEQSY